jgi:fructose 1,6-bisphosphatase
MMKTALSIIKVDIGSIGGHIKPNNPFWDYVRDKVARKALELREQGFSGFRVERTGIFGCCHASLQ